MASNYYKQYTVDGKCTLTKRSTRQGRRIGTGVGKKPRPYTATDEEQVIIEEKARSMNMSVASYICLAAVYFDLNFLNKKID